jgi:hypothetical protein
MYSLRVNTRTKELIEEVAGIVGLSTSEIMRRAARKMERNNLRLLNETTVAVLQASTKNVIKFHIPKTYHNFLDDFVVSDMEPLAPRESKHFRTCLIAACLDTRAKSQELHLRQQRLDEEYEKFNSAMVAERRALYAEVM